MQVRTLSKSTDNRVANIRKAIETLETLLDQAESTVLYNDLSSALKDCKKKLTEIPDGKP
jgi:hypothetical protein